MTAYEVFLLSLVIGFIVWGIVMLRNEKREWEKQKYERMKSREQKRIDAAMKKYLELTREA